jgi:hypothetical protein
MLNVCKKTRDKATPYEIWEGGGWTWKVLKKWQAEDDKPYARWFCFVTSPVCPEGEYGDTYVKDITQYARRTYQDPLALNETVKSKSSAPIPVKNTWKKVTANGVSVLVEGESQIKGVAEPEAFLRGDALDRFFYLTDGGMHHEEPRKTTIFSER